MQFLTALRQRGFALLWFGQTASRLGDGLFRIALAWWVLEKTGSAAAMSTVLVVSSLPMLGFLLIGGVVVDRLPRFRVLFTSDLVNGAVTAAVTALAASGRLELWHVYIAVATFGLAEAFFFPAFAAAVPQLVPPESLPSANSLVSLSYQLTGVAAPALGAALVALGGTPAAFGINSASFFLSAALLTPLLRIRLPRLGPSAQTPLRDLVDGLRTVAGRTWLWLSIAFFSLINIVDAGPRNVALPFLIHDDLGLEVGALGAVTSAIAVGSVLAAVVLGRQSRLRRRGLLLYGGEIVMGGMLLAIGLAPSLPWVLTAAVVYGVGISVANLVWTNLLQEKVPPDRLGRVTSLDALGSFLFLPIGFGVAGWLAERIGAAHLFRLGGSAAMALALAVLLLPSIRRLD